jgi:AP2 domain
MTPLESSLPLCICGNPQCKIPYGYCHCQCGRKTAISTCNNLFKGEVRGMPRRRIRGHHETYLPSIEYAKPFRLRGEYCRLIPLTQGLWTIVSAHRYEHLMQWNWRAWWNETDKCFYAIRTGVFKDGETGKSFSMARQILGLVRGDRRTADHIETGETLDNSDNNLRIASKSQQQHNKRKPKNNTTGFKGVSAYRIPGKWQAFIAFNGKTKWLGIHDTPEAAHEAYCKAAELHHGEFARTK